MDFGAGLRSWSARIVGRALGARTRRRLGLRCLGALALVAVSAAGLILGLGSAARAVTQDTTTQTTPGQGQSGRAQPDLSDPTVSTQLPICGDQDGSEQPLVFQCASFTRVPDQQM